MWSIGKQFGLYLFAGSIVVLFSGSAFAQHSHDYGANMSPRQEGKALKREPIQSMTVEGWRVTLQVMSMAEHMKHMHMAKGGSHGEAEHSKSHMFMVTIQDTASKEIISDAKVAYAVLNPSGGKETGKLAWSGDHYGAGFSPKKRGTYQVQLMIEGGGMERKAKFSYKVN
jgi:hypothetical protein